MNTYGQIAYEAYCDNTSWKSLISGAPLPQWTTLDPKIKAAWEYSASVVIDCKTREVTA